MSRQFMTRSALMALSLSMAIWVVACGQSKSSGNPNKPAAPGATPDSNNKSGQDVAAQGAPAALIQLDPTKAQTATDVSVSSDNLSTNAATIIDGVNKDQNASLLKQICGVSVVDSPTSAAKDVPVKVALSVADSSGACKPETNEKIVMTGKIADSGKATLTVASDSATADTATAAKTVSAELQCKDKDTTLCNASVIMISFNRPPSLVGAMAVVNRVYTQNTLATLTDASKIAKPLDVLTAFQKRMTDFRTAQSTDAKSQQILIVKTTEIVHGPTTARIVMGQPDLEVLDILGTLRQHQEDKKPITGILAPRKPAPSATTPEVSSLLLDWLKSMKVDTTKTPITDVKWDVENSVSRYLVQATPQQEVLTLQAEFNVPNQQVAPQVLDFQITMTPIAVIDSNANDPSKPPVNPPSNVSGNGQNPPDGSSNNGPGASNAGPGTGTTPSSGGSTQPSGNNGAGVGTPSSGAGNTGNTTPGCNPDDGECSTTPPAKVKKGAHKARGK